MRIPITPRTVNLAFIARVEEISGESLLRCMQCGTCTASCPMAEGMELPPRTVVHLAQMGLEGLVRDVNTTWLCASCHTCEARCPRSLDLPKVMEAIRLLTLRANRDRVDPRRLEPTVIAGAPPIAMVACFRKLTA